MEFSCSYHGVKHLASPSLQCCSRVLEGLLREDDEVVVVWYLMGWLHYLMDDHDSARFFLEQTERVCTGNSSL